jgi:hypothetical protein
MGSNNAWNSGIPVDIQYGGTDAISFNVNGVLISNTTTTGALSALTLTAGEIVIGATGAAPVAGTITAGAGINVANGVNSITISGTSGGFTWHTITTTTALVAQNAYSCNCSAGAFTVTLPVAPTLGDTYIVTVSNAGAHAVTIAYNASQYIQFGSSTSTTTSGTLVTTALGDTLTIVAMGADQFQVISSIGNITVN